MLATDALAFSYTNRTRELGYLMILAIDRQGTVFWYYPAYSREDQDPQSIAIRNNAVDIRLADQVRHQLEPGPLRLMALSTDQAQASQWRSEQQEGPAQLRIHPSMANGFRDGDLASIESLVGSMQVRVKLDSQVRNELALMDKGGWLAAGRCANALTPAEASDQGGCAVYYDTPIRLREPEPTRPGTGR